jgi:hypothetical protein
MKAAKKQSQFKAKQTCPEQGRMEPIAGLWPEIRSTKPEIRNNFTKQSQFGLG